MFDDRIITWSMAGEGMALDDRKLIRTRKARPKDGPAPTIDELRAALTDDDLFRMKRVPEDGERLLLGVADWQTFLSKTFRCTDYRDNAAIRRVLQNWTFLESAIGRLQYYAKRLEHPMPIVCGRWLCHRRVADFTAVPCTAAEAVRHQAMLERGLAALNDWLRPAARRFGILANGQADRAVTADVREELYRATAPPPPDSMQSAPPVPVLETTASTVEAPASASLVKPRRKPPGRRSIDQNGDKRIADAWATKKHPTHADLAKAFGIKMKDVKDALDRQAKRNKRQKHQNNSTV